MHQWGKHDRFPQLYFQCRLCLAWASKDKWHVEGWGRPYPEVFTYEDGECSPTFDRPGFNLSFTCEQYQIHLLLEA